MAKSRNYLKRRREIEQCTTKVKYFDKGKAWAAAKRLSPYARAYRCPGLKGEPKHFHVTGGPTWLR